VKDIDMETDLLFALSIFSSVAQFAGLGYFLWQVYKGLKVEIKSLHTTVDVQKQTLEAMEMRIKETEKFRDLYRQFINELPEDLERYRKVLSALKDEVIKELEEANARKDEKLKQVNQFKLDEINDLDNLLKELPKVKDNLELLVQAQNSIQEKLEIFEPSRPLGKFMKELERRAKEQGYDDSDTDNNLNTLQNEDVKLITVESSDSNAG
jgi:hypothetical protein